MTTYYRVSDAALRDLSAEQHAALAPSKQADLRLYIVDAQPVPSASEVVVADGVVVGPIEAHKVWVLRAKTAAELDGESINVERAKAQESLADLDVRRAVTRVAWDAFTANQLRAEQWRDRQVLLRVAHLLMRRVRQESA